MELLGSTQINPQNKHFGSRSTKLLNTSYWTLSEVRHFFILPQEYHYWVHLAQKIKIACLKAHSEIWDNFW